MMSMILHQKLIVIVTKAVRRHKEGCPWSRLNQRKWLRTWVTWMKGVVWKTALDVDKRRVREKVTKYFSKASFIHSPTVLFPPNGTRNVSSRRTMWISWNKHFLILMNAYSKLSSFLKDHCWIIILSYIV